MVKFTQILAALLVTFLLVMCLPLQAGDETAAGFTKELSSATVDASGAVWIGGKFSAIFRYQNEQLIRFDSFSTPIPDSGVTAAFVDRDSIKWFGTTRGYVLRYDDKTWQVMPFARPISDIKAICQGPDGTIWIGSRTQGIFKYQNARIENSFPPVDGRFGNLEAMDFDGDGNLWVAIRGGVLCFDGHEWTTFGRELPGNDAIWALAWDKHSKAVYCGNMTGLYRYENGNWSLFANRQSGMNDNHVRWIRTNGMGQIWVGHGQAQSGVSRFDGTSWTGFVPGSPENSDEITDVAFSSNGRTWFPGRRHGLRMYDGQTWFEFPMQSDRNDPRFVWRRRQLRDLMKEEATTVELAAVLTDPFEYRGKKIRFVGRIKSGFELSELLGRDGQRFGIWPAVHHELARFRMTTANGGELPSDQLIEFSGYLESGGYYGHMGNAPHQFFIVEMYPHGDGPITKAELQTQLNDFINKDLPHLPLPDLPETEAIANARTRLAGSWLLISGAQRGKEEKPVSNMTLEISHDQITFRKTAQQSLMKFRVDPSRELPAIDLLTYEKRGNEDRLRGITRCIYKLDGDALTLCFSDDPERRPTKFASEAETKTDLGFFKRIGNVPESGVTISAETTDPGIVVPKRL